MATFLAARLGEFFREISTWPTSKLVVFSALSGITSHIVYFIHGELDHRAPQIFFGFLLAPATITAIFFFHLGISLLQSSITTATIWASFVSGLMLSIVTYRLFLHPLRKFPGPVMARTTKFWGAFKTYQTFQNCYLVRDLHQKYGDFVRLGPNELSIISESAVPLVVKFDKGPWYNVGLPAPGTQLTRNRETHRIRRRIWDRAFTDEAIRKYLPGIIIRSDELLSVLAAKKGLANITEYVNYYMWDSMGDVTFSKSFKMLPSHGKADKWMRVATASQYAFGIFSHLPYLPLVLGYIPFSNKEFKGFLRWSGSMVEERKQRNPERKDVFSWILAAEDSNKGIHAVSLDSEARLAILAGSDTTASTLANIFFYMANNPEEQRKLHEEIDALYSAYGGDEEKLFKELAFDGCPNTTHLEGVIREALRINTVVPGSPQRIAPPEGFTVDGRFIPGGTAIYLSLFTSARDPRNFEKPTEFIPERWYKPEKYPLTHKQKIFFPFWTGTYSCVGKPYAYMQLRIVTARVMRKFSLALAEGITEEKVLREAVDLFILYMGKIDLLLTERNVE